MATARLDYVLYNNNRLLGMAPVDSNGHGFAYTSSILSICFEVYVLTSSCYCVVFVFVLVLYISAMLIYNSLSQ